MTVLRVGIRVRPGAGRTRVGGQVGDPPRLVVAVASRAVNGQATEAALAAVAEAVGVRRRDVSLVTGVASRDKVVDIEGEMPILRTAIDRLLAS